jgi:hypothetical protein
MPVPLQKQVHHFDTSHARDRLLRDSEFAFDRQVSGNGSRTGKTMEHRCADYGRRGHQRQGLSSGHLIVRNRFTAVTMADGQIAVCFGSLNFANRTTSGRNRNESGACICPRTWPPKFLAPRRTRARIQDDRTYVSVRTVRSEGGFGVTNLGRCHFNSGRDRGPAIECGSLQTVQREPGQTG